MKTKRKTKKIRINYFFLSLILLFFILLIFLFSRAKKDVLGTNANKFTVGVNIRELSHYGYCEDYPTIKECIDKTQDALPLTKETDTDEDLKELQIMGAKVVRVFIANNRITHEEAAKRLDVLLTKAANYNISVIPVLIDFWKNGYMNYPKGTESFYTYYDPYANLYSLNVDFFKSGYKTGTLNYKNFVKTVVKKNKYHKNIYAWEVGNELDVVETHWNQGGNYFEKHGVHKEFVDFLNDISNMVISIDNTHPISTGFSTLTLIWRNGKALNPSVVYPLLKNYKIISVHQYNGDRKGVKDVRWALNNNKKVIIGETGFSGEKDRSASLSAEINYWKEMGVSLVLQWGFMSKNINQIVVNSSGQKWPRVNDYSPTFGMDGLPRQEIGYGHDFDYDSLFNLYKKISTAP